MRNTALAIAAPVAPKHDNMHGGRVKTMLAHAIAPPLTPTHGFGAAFTGWGCPTTGQPVPPRRRHAIAAAQHTESRGGGADPSFARRASYRVTVPAAQAAAGRVQG